MYIFDFDHTLKMDNNKPAPEAVKAVADAARSGRVALASAGKYDSYKRKWLKQYFPENLGKIVDTDAFQSSQKDKAKSIEKIMKFFGIPVSCGVLIDDSSSNENYATKAGASFQKVDGKVGVAEADIMSAIVKVRQHCNAAALEE